MARRPRRRPGRRPARPDDPRIRRTRTAVVDAATRLFLREGYGGTTMDAIAIEAGIAKRSLYNHYADKDALFLEIVSGVIGFAEGFARGLRAELRAATAVADPAETLHDVARRLAVAIVRPEVIALRRLLIGESRTFPGLAREYFHRAPGRVIAALASGFEHLTSVRALRTPDPRRAAAQFAYLVAGAPLDRAMLAGTVPPPGELLAGAREGVETFLARYAGRTSPTGRRAAGVSIALVGSARRAVGGTAALVLRRPTPGPGTPGARGE